MAERDADSGPGSSKSANAQSWTNRVVGAIGGVILASGVVGTVISFYLQGRSWEYQTRSAKIDKDSAAVLAALEGVDKLIDEKWLSTYELNDAVKTKVEGARAGRGGQTLLRGQPRVGASAQHTGVEPANRGRFAVWR